MYYRMYVPVEKVDLEFEFEFVMEELPVTATVTEAIVAVGDAPRRLETAMLELLVIWRAHNTTLISPRNLARRLPRLDDHPRT